MNSKHFNSEKGQAIVYLALGLVVFLGFVALAIDGGMVLADRRDAQNATDASALAGASAAAQIVHNEIVAPKPSPNDCTYSVLLSSAKMAAISAAESRSTSNGYTLGTDPNDYVKVTCGDSHGTFMDVEVGISKNTPTSFLQVLVPKANLTNKMTAIARLHTATSYGNGNAIVALNTSDKCAMEIGAGFSGNTLVDVNGGGIFSNGCLDGKGGADVDVSGGEISYFYNNFKVGVFDPPPTELTNLNDRLSPPIVNLKPSDCDLPGVEKVASLPESTAANPMHPGLWCVTGNVNITGGTYYGYGVTIYVMNGTLLINGGTIHFEAPYVDEFGNGYPPVKHAIYGLLFYVPVNMKGKNGVDLTGNNNSYYQGSILAPTSDIQINGNGTSDCFHSQLIGYNVKLDGTSLFNITYDPSQNLSTSATIDLNK
jgi:hypothetical protein